ncbi:MAG: hypothetical protein IPK13_20710 [Deltaproteobacteria bacterium]|nr:hypothetical protein [Deltaproteobacteria bacterium]
MMITTTLITTLLVSAGIGGQAESPADKLVGPMHLVIRMDEDLFTLFSALNALGYARETTHGGPPLEASVFHPIRARVREAVQKASRTGSAKTLRDLVSAHPEPIEVYAEAVLAGARGVAPSSRAAALLELVPTLSKFREEAGLGALFDELAEEQRTLAKRLMKDAGKDLEAASKIVGESVVFPSGTVVLPNWLDAQDEVRVVATAGERYLIVGAADRPARRSILLMAIRPRARSWIDAGFRGAKKFQSDWSSLSRGSAVVKRFGDPRAYLSEVLAQAIAHRAMTNNNAEEDEAFIEATNRQGLPWTRSALAILDASAKNPGEKLADMLPSLLARHGPAR